MLKIIKNINMRERSFNNSWKITRISTRPTKINCKGALVKTEEQKNTQLTNAQIDALLTKIMDNRSLRAYVENIPVPEWPIS